MWCCSCRCFICSRSWIGRILVGLIDVASSSYGGLGLTLGMVGNARLGGLIEDLGMDDGQFEWLLTGFYIT